MSRFPSVTTLADATSITPDSNFDVNIHVNTQGAGAFTINNPIGPANNGQKLIIRIKSSAVQTYTFGSAYRGGTLALPSASTGGSKTDYLGFMYNAADSKWDILATETNH